MLNVVLEKSKKDILQVFGPNPEPHHHEFAQWASKALPNQNWQIWAARNYKQNPEQFTSETKQTLEHYGGSTHIPEIKDLRFEKEHDLEAGINLFKEAEKKYNDRIKDKLNLVEPRPETNLFVKVPSSDHHWYDLGVGSCKAEGKAMGHCGNVPSEYEGDRVLSLRKEHILGGKKYHEPHLTFIYNNGYLGEMKGRANEKPSSKYHKYIVELLKDPRIKGILGGGYQDRKNFKFSDLSPEHQEEVLKANPNLITDTKSKHNLIKIIDADWPKKHSKTFYNIVANLAADPKLHDKMVNSKNYQVREVAAQNPNLDPKFHEKLVYDAHDNVRAAIAERPDLDPKFHERLVNDKDSRVRAAIAERSDLDPKFHERLVNDKDSRVRAIIAQKPNLDPRFHEKLANDKSIKIKRIIAEKPNLDPKLYEKLIGNEDREIKISIAGKQDLEPKFHERLVNDKDPRVREAIAYNPNLDPKFYGQLLNDEDSSVRRAIANKPNLDPKLYERLVNDGNSWIREAIAKKPNLDPKFHEQLVNDEAWHVRAAIAKNPNLHPKFHERLVNDKDSFVRKIIAQKPNLDPKFHERLVNDEDREVRAAIINNPNLNPKVHEQLVNHGSYNIRTAIAKNPNLDPKFHERLVNDEEWYVRAAIASNPNLDPKFHEKLVNDKKEHVRAAIASNPNLDPKFHEQLVNDKEPRAREAIARRPDLDPKFHERLVNDTNPNIRLAIAKNPNLDPKFHEKLAQDKYKMVREAMINNPSYRRNPRSSELQDDNLQKSKKDILQVFGPNPEPHHHEFAQWASKALPNQNWQVWAARNYKQNPEQFTSKIKQTLEHYGGSTHIPEIKELRFEKEHDLKAGIELFREAEKKYNNRIKDKLNLVEPRPETDLFVKVPNSDHHWYDLGVSTCEAEGKAMGHCGNVPSKHKGDRILSLRKEHVLGGKKYHEPHLTFIYNNGYLGEMKGRANEKPSSKYHEHIVELLKDPRVKGILGGGYQDEKNFKFSDLSPEHQEEVLKANPNLITDIKSESNIEKILSTDLPEKHRKNVILSVAENPNLHPKFQERLVNDKELLVRAAIAQNPNLDPKLHERLVNDEDPLVRRAIANKPNLDPKLHEKLINDRYSWIRETIAKKPNLDPKFHEQLINDEAWHVRAAIAKKPNLDPKFHERLVNDKDSRVRAIIAQKPNLHSKFHEKLVNDEDREVRAAIINNPNLNPKVHEQLVNHGSHKIRTAIAKNPNLDPKLHERLVNDKVRSVRLAIAQNPNLHPKFHEKLINDKEPSVRETIAQNPNLDPKFQERLVNDKNWRVRTAIAKNSNLDPKFYGQLVNNRDSSIREAIAQNPNLDPKFHKKLANDEDPWIRRAIAKNPNLDPKFHEQLVNDKDHEVRLAIAENPNLDPKFHEKLVNDEGPWVRAAIAENPNLHPKFHEKLVNDEEPKVREAIARRPDLDPRFHEQLANDTIPYVREAMINSPYYRRNLRSSELQDDNLQKSKKDILQVFGPNPEPHHHDFAQWASKALPNQNWQIWAARNYKQNPEQFTSDIRQTLEHYGGSTHIPEIKDLRFEKEHDLESGIELFRKAERKYNNRIKNKLNLVEPRPETNLFVKVPNSDHHWYDLGVGSCKAEGKAMGHCGNAPSEREGDRVLSLRKEHVLDGKKYHEPHLTFIYNDGYLGEMKGRANEKPSPKYHEHIVELLKDPRIKGILGGGYQDEKNFKFSDLSPEHQDEVLKANPGLITDTESDSNIEKILSTDLPEKHRESVIFSIAKKPNLDPKFHEKLVNNKDSRVRAAIANKPNLDPKLHERLVNDKNYEVREAIVKNPNLDPKLHERLVNDEHPWVRAAIIKNPNLDPKLHEQLVNNKSLDIRTDIASNPNLDSRFHEQLVYDDDFRVRAAIAENPNLDPKFHKKLANDEDPLVRKAIAQNPNLDPRLHERLVNDKDHEVRKTIAENPNLDPKFHEKLVNDEGPWVRTAIAENPNLDPKFHEQLVNDESWRVRLAIAHNPNLHPKFYEKLINDKNPFVRTAIAERPDLDPKFHEKLAQDKHEMVREAIINNPSYRRNLRSSELQDDNLQKSKKDILQVFGPNPEPHHHEFAQWASKALPNQNWQVWAARNYKQNPEQFTSDIRQTLEHYGGSVHIPEIKELRFEKEHDLEAGIELFREAESKYNNRIKDKLNLVEPRPETDLFVKVPNSDHHWYDLGVGSCKAEGKAMGHCGNAPSEYEGDRILSLRKEHILSGKKYHEPHLTFIYNNGYLGEMKGRANEKPSPKYHEHIVELLKDPRIKGILGGGYQDEKNFKFSDLSPEHQEEVLKANPNLITDIESENNIEKILSTDLPEKHRESVIFSIAKNPNLHPKFQERLVNDEDSRVREAIAQNPNLHPKFYGQLVNDKQSWIRKAIANKPNLDPELYERLVNDEHSWVRKAIAQNPNLDPKFHEKLVNDEEWYVRATIAENPNLDPKFHERLVNDKDSRVRAAIAKKPNLDPKFHEQLVNDKDHEVRAAITNNPNLNPKVHEQLVNHGDRKIRTAIAKNPNLDPKLHERLVNDEHLWVREAIAQNPNLNPKFHGQLVNDTIPYVRVAIASNPNLDPKFHERLVNDKDSRVRAIIAQKPNLDPKFHEQLVNDKDHEVRAAIASNPNLHPKFHEKLVNDEEPKVREAIARRPGLDPRFHEQLANDTIPYVREAMISNPSYRRNLRSSELQDDNLQKSKKDILQVFGPTPEPHHHEFAQWASKALPNQNWQVWAARNYKRNPEQFTSETKQTLEHYGGSTHIPEIKDLRFEKEHDLEAGIKLFKEAEKKYKDKLNYEGDSILSHRKEHGDIEKSERDLRDWRLSYEKHAQPKVAYHYSSVEGLKTIDPKKMSTGVSGSFSKRFNPSKIKDFPHVSFYYINDTPEDVVRAKAKSRYVIKLDPDVHKLYDLSIDCQNLVKDAVNQNNGVWDYEKVLKKIKDYGYYGVWARQSCFPTVSNTVHLFYEHPVSLEEKL